MLESWNLAIPFLHNYILRNVVWKNNEALKGINFNVRGSNVENNSFGGKNVKLMTYKLLSPRWAQCDLAAENSWFIPKAENDVSFLKDQWRMVFLIPLILLFSSLLWISEEKNYLSFEGNVRLLNIQQVNDRRHMILMLFLLLEYW